MKRKKIAISTVFISLVLAVGVMGQDYQKALNMSVRFFGAQRCGNDVHSWIGHESCHWHDSDISGVDLEGGWHDCGDHIKFGNTGGYSAALILHAYLNFPDAFQDNYSYENSAGSANGIPDVLIEAKHYTDYALKMLQGNTFYYQVGDMRTDHQSCSPPDYQTSNETSGRRRSYSVTGGGASNIAGSHAAALAMMSRAYREFDAAYADECLAMAEKLYDFGDAKHEAIGSMNGSTENSPYSDNTWADDMAFAAAELYAATEDEKYMHAAVDFANEGNYTMPTHFVLDFSTVAPLASYSIYKHVWSGSSYLNALESEVEDYIDHMSSLGFALFLSGDHDGNDVSWGSMKFASAAAYTAMMAHDLTDNTAYRDFAQANIDFILGSHGGVDDAPAGFSFLTGYASSDAMSQAHHSAAFGATPCQFGTGSGQWADWNTSNRRDLEGAVIGGPATEYYFKNFRNDYISTEVGIYYNAPFVAAVSAFLYDGGDDDDDDDDGDNGKADNVSGYLGWGAYVDELGSSIDTSGGLLSNDSVVTISFDMVAEDAGNEIWPYGALISEIATPLAEPNHIVIEYTADNDFEFILPMETVTQDGAFYRAPLPATGGSWSVDTLKLTNPPFVQPEWADDVIFDKSIVESIEIAPDFNGAEGAISIRVLKIDGFTVDQVPVTGINENNSFRNISLTAVTEEAIGISVPESGVYNIKAFTLDGRQVGHIVSNMNAGNNNVPWLGKNTFSSNVVLLQITGKGYAQVLRVSMQ
jgi:hypothetical protein